MLLKGIPASPGVAIGKVFILDSEAYTIIKRRSLKVTFRVRSRASRTPLSRRGRRYWASRNASPNSWA